MSSTGKQVPVNEPGVALTDSDYLNLKRRWRHRPLVDAARIRRVDSGTGASYMGREDGRSYEGLLIPYFLPGESQAREYRLRRDHPDIEIKGGKQKESSKYLSPRGRSNMLYFVPGLSPDTLRNVGLDVIITEGEFKTLALWRLAHYKSSTARFLPIGLGGVWNWRGVVGKTEGPNGDRRDVRGVIPDIDLLVWEGRRVIIAFDADAEKNDQVAVARNQFTRELRGRGAEVAALTWDFAQGKGIDDLLANVGADKVLVLLDDVDFEAESVNKVGVDQIAETITAKHCFARDAGGKLYVCRDGCYRPDGNSFVAQEVKTLLKRWKLASTWTRHKAGDVAAYLAADARPLLDRPPLDVVNVLNGLLNITTGEFKKHSPEYLSPVQLPVKYDPNRRCPKWEKFISEVFRADTEALAWEILAWLMTPDTSIQRAILLFGAGANGKSTYLRALTAFLGKANVTNVGLNKLENDRFSVARLVGKLANICPDLPSTELINTSTFKAITGGDTLLAENKFEHAFEFTPYARLIFSSNHLPKSRDASEAFYRRWIVVPFERTFVVGAPGTVRSEELDAMLADPAELSGVLNKALEAIQCIRKKGFTESDATKRAAMEFQQATDPLAAWFDRHTILRSNAFISKDQLFGEYLRACAEAGRPAITKTAFGNAMKKFRTTVTEGQRTLNDRRVWCYVGIEMVAGSAG